MNGSDAHERLVEEVACGIAKTRGHCDPYETSYRFGFYYEDADEEPLEDFVERPDWQMFRKEARAALAVVYERLREITPEMSFAAKSALAKHIRELPAEVRAASKKKGGSKGLIVTVDAKHALRFHAMLAASAVAPAKAAPSDG